MDRTYHLIARDVFGCRPLSSERRPFKGACTLRGTDETGNLYVTEDATQLIYLRQPGGYWEHNPVSPRRMKRIETNRRFRPVTGINKIVGALLTLA